MICAARSAKAIVAAIVLALGTSGITEASTTLRAETPFTRRRSSTTAISDSGSAVLLLSLPIRQLPTGWEVVPVKEVAAQARYE